MKYIRLSSILGISATIIMGICAGLLLTSDLPNVSKQQMKSSVANSMAKNTHVR